MGDLATALFTNLDVAKQLFYEDNQRFGFGSIVDILPRMRKSFVLPNEPRSKELALFCELMSKQYSEDRLGAQISIQNLLPATVKRSDYNLSAHLELSRVISWAPLFCFEKLLLAELVAVWDLPFSFFTVTRTTTVGDLLFKHGCFQALIAVLHSEEFFASSLLSKQPWEELELAGKQYIQYGCLYFNVSALTKLLQTNFESSSTSLESNLVHNFSKMQNVPMTPIVIKAVCDTISMLPSYYQDWDVIMQHWTQEQILTIILPLSKAKRISSHFCGRALAKGYLKVFHLICSLVDINPFQIGFHQHICRPNLFVLAARSGNVHILDQVCQQFQQQFKNHYYTYHNDDDWYEDVIEYACSQKQYDLLETLLHRGFFGLRLQPDSRRYEYVNAVLHALICSSGGLYDKKMSAALPLLTSAILRIIRSFEDFFNYDIYNNTNSLNLTFFGIRE
jgi:hypothetical protein